MNKLQEEKTIEYQTSGKYGYGRVVRSDGKPTGIRQVEIIWKGKPPLFATSLQVDIKALNCTTLPQAVNKACHNLGFLPVLKHEEIKGPNALVSLYYGNPNKSQGYATISKKNMRSLKFSLGRIDLEKMMCKTPYEALKKVAFSTGQIKLKQS
jgi:hypothetical protein